jgi:SAM-dependent methyltransferase
MIMASYIETVPTSRQGHSEVRLQCPHCGGWIGHLPEANVEDTTLVCSDCCFKLTSVHGIWKSLLPERAGHFSHVLNADQCIPSAEQPLNAEYYLSLPYRDISGRDSQQWSIGSRSFRYIKRHILPGIIQKADSQLRILDLGAGNGWLSYRLALEGHAPIAVDLLTNDRDGLGAASHYKKQLTTLFPRFQADLNTLPFADDGFDLVIYNASFHYSENYERTLAEALRCTSPGGTVLIAGTPWFSDEEDSQQIITEYSNANNMSSGVSPDALNGLGYLTDKRLQRMEASFGIHWQIHTPNYGVHRLMRQVFARLHDVQEPPQLRIYSTKARK